MFKKFKNYRKKYTVKIIPHNSKHLFSYSFSNRHLLVTLLVLLGFILSFYISANFKVIEKSLKIGELNRHNKKQQEKIKELQTEKEKISMLLVKQNESLSKKVIEIQTHDNEIRKLVGLKPKPIQKSIKAYRGRCDYTVLKDKIKNLEENIKKTEEEIEALKNPALSYKKEIERKKIVARLERIPSRWPANGYISSYFGWRSHPIYGGMHFHTGIDIIAGYGTKICATASGRVISAGYTGGYGYTVEIDHENGWKTLYAHCSEILVKQSSFVVKGQIIARVGCSGAASGAHVHYEVYKGDKRIDPYVCLNTENQYFAQVASKLKKL